MSEIEKTAQISTKALRVLLLVCASTLLVIVITLASAVFDAQSMQVIMPATQQASDACGMPARISIFLPSNCQSQPQNELR